MKTGLASRRAARWLAALLLVTWGAGQAAVAGYNVQTNKLPGALDGVRRLAVAPGSCAGDVDCLWLETKVAEELKALGRYGIIEAQEVRQRMLELGINRFGEGDLKGLAEKLGVEAFVVPIVGHSGTEVSGVSGVVVGGWLYGDTEKIAKGSAELIVVRASDGKAVIRGTGSGKSEIRTGKGVVLKVFKEIIAKAFGEAN